MPMKNDREYRAMTMTAIVDVEAEEQIVEGYASTFNEPYLLWADDEVEVWETVDRNAFDNADMSDVIMQYDHEGRVFARVRNNTLIVRPDEKGLFIRADLGGTDIGRSLYQEIAGGYTDKMSFGFIVGEDKREATETNGRTRLDRVITKIDKVFDVSAVSLPANNSTAIEASVRGIDGVIEDARAERLKMREMEEKRQRLLVKAKALKGEKHD